MEEVGRVELNAVLLSEDRGVVIDFWGPWCQPCRTLRPHLDKMAIDRSEHWRFVAVNAEAHPDVAERYEVMATPTIVMIRGGEEVHRLAGATPPSSIADALDVHTS